MVFEPEEEVADKIDKEKAKRLIEQLYRENVDHSPFDFVEGLLYGLELAKTISPETANELRAKNSEYISSNLFPSYWGGLTQMRGR